MGVVAQHLQNFSGRGLNRLSVAERKQGAEKPGDLLIQGLLISVDKTDRVFRKVSFVKLLVDLFDKIFRAHKSEVDDWTISGPPARRMIGCSSYGLSLELRSMIAYKMMEEVVCYCSKCKLELNHRIIQVDKGRPKRVLCLTCNNEHSYRKSAPGKAGERKQRTSAPKIDLEGGWPTKLERTNKTAKAYGMDKVFLLDGHVDHQLFGVGLVVDLI